MLELLSDNLCGAINRKMFLAFSIYIIILQSCKHFTHLQNQRHLVWNSSFFAMLVFNQSGFEEGSSVLKFCKSRAINSKVNAIRIWMVSSKGALFWNLDWFLHPGMAKNTISIKPSSSLVKWNTESNIFGLPFLFLMVHLKNVDKDRGREEIRWRNIFFYKDQLTSRLLKAKSFEVATIYGRFYHVLYTGKMVGLQNKTHCYSIRSNLKKMGPHSVVVVTTESQYIGFWIGGPLT